MLKIESIANSVIDAVEDILDEKGVIVPDEDRPEGNDTPFYGCTWATVRDAVVQVINNCLSEYAECFADEAEHLLQKSTESDGHYAGECYDKYEEAKNLASCFETVIEELQEDEYR